MSDAIKTLEALRDAAQWLDNEHGLQEAWLTSACDRAIAALRAAQPAPANACAGFRCKSPVACRNGHCHYCDNCGRPENAHQPSEQPARQHCTCAFDDVPGEYPCAVHGDPGGQCRATEIGSPPCRCRNCVAEQPAPKVEVPPKINRVDWGMTIGGTKSYEHYDAIHAAAVTLAERCERAEADVKGVEQKNEGWVLEAKRLRGRISLAKQERDEARAQLAEAQAALREARRQERERCARVLASSGDPLGESLLRALPEEGA